MQKVVKTGKYTDINKMSSFGLIEENMELSHIHLAVKLWPHFDIYDVLSRFFFSRSFFRV